MGDLELIFDGALARLRFNAPARRNALSRATWRALPDACATIAARADSLVVIVEGAGGHFSAGADIAEFETVYRNAEATRDYVDAMQAALGALAAEIKPLATVTYRNLPATGQLLDAGDFATLPYPEGAALHFKTKQ